MSQNAGRFATTRWSMVVEAGRQSSPEAAEALTTLCGIYWFPLYAYVRRQGHSIDDAQDLQGPRHAESLEHRHGVRLR